MTVENPPAAPLSPLHTPHPYPGVLVVVEGIDGSGKSTQIRLLHRWLEAQGHDVVFTEWNSSELVRATTKFGKKKNLLTPTTFSLLHATDFADRFSTTIVPPLKAGMIVLADRYVYTAFARDVVRGVDRTWVRRVYAFALRPDVALYFKTPIDVSVARILNGRQKIKYYEAGMDLRLSADPVESFRQFQGRILQEYDAICAEFGLDVIDATRSIDAQQRAVRRISEAAIRKRRALAIEPRVTAAPVVERRSARRKEEAPK
ncbi:MAG TPA: thymidylate kinase [Polyangia bacterium]